MLWWVLLLGTLTAKAGTAGTDEVLSLLELLECLCVKFGKCPPKGML